MPLTGDDRKLGKLADDLRSLGQPNTPAQQGLLEPVKREIKTVLKTEFSSSVDPSGQPWQETVRRHPALVSKKLPYAFEFGARDGAIVGVGRSKRDLLDAHQYGHFFSARHVEALGQFLTFNRKGKLVSNGRVLNKKGEVKRGYYQTFAREHTIRDRELPVRQIIPEGDQLPPLWEGAVERGVTAGMQRWYEKAAK